MRHLIKSFRCPGPKHSKLENNNLKKENPKTYLDKKYFDLSNVEKKVVASFYAILILTQIKHDCISDEPKAWVVPR